MTGRVRLRHLVGAVSRPRAAQSGPGMYLMRGGCAPERTYSITTYQQAPSAGRVGWTWCGEGAESLPQANWGHPSPSRRPAADDDGEEAPGHEWLDTATDSIEIHSMEEAEDLGGCLTSSGTCNRSHAVKSSCHPSCRYPGWGQSLEEAGIGFWTALNQSSCGSTHVVLRGTCNCSRCPHVMLLSHISRKP
jgi:hypothetical protein